MNEPLSPRFNIGTQFSRILVALTVMVGLFGSLAASVIDAPTATAAVGTNQAINYQGRLLTNTGAVVPDGTYAMEFKIYQDGPGNVVNDTGGTLKWTEDWVYGVNSPDNRITVRNGYFSVNLGTICTFTSTTCTASTGNSQTNAIIDWNQSVLWLSVAVGQNLGTNATFAASNPDPEMLPMRRLSSSVYSLNSNALGGLTSSQFVQLGQNPSTAQVDGSTNSAIFLNKTSTGNFIQFQKVAGTDVFIVDNSGNIAFGNNSAKTIAFATAATAVGQGLSITGQTAGATTNAGGAVTIQGGTSTTTGVGGLLSLLGGNSGAGGTNGGVTIDTGTSGSSQGTIAIGNSAINHTISIGNGAAIESLNIGSGTSVSTTNISGGVNGSFATISLQAGSSGIIAIGTFNSNTINIGSVGSTAVNSTVNIANSTGASQTVVIGSTNGISSTSINGGSTGSINVGSVGSTNIASTIHVADSTGASNQIVTIGATNNAGNTVTIQGGTGSAAVSLQVASTGTIAIGTVGVAKTIQIGQTTAAVTDTINIGNSAFAASIDNVTIGNLLSTSTTTLQAGTGNINLSTNSATASVIVKDSTNNTTAFLLQNSQSSSLLSADTTSQNLLVNSDFEAGISNGWSNVTSASVQDTSGTNAEFGSDSLAVTTTAAANSGVRDNGFTSTITPSGAQAYTLSFWAKTSVSLTTLVAGYNMGGADIPCTLNSYTSGAASTTVSTSAFIRFYCTFTPTAGTMAYVYFTQGSTATIRVIYLDGVQLETGSIPTNYRTGTLNVNTVNVASSIGINYIDSGNTSALSVNGATASLFNVDTNINRATIGPINGCSAIIGQGRLCIGQTINAGVSGGVVNQNSTLINTSTVGNSSYASLIYLNDTGTGVNTDYDVVQDNTGSTNGSATINGIIVKTKAANAGNLLDLQAGASGTSSVFTVTNAGVVNVGNPTTDGVQTNLQLDSFSTFADSGTCSATVNQGAMYYNTHANSASLRTCQNALWTDVVTNKDLGLITFGVVPDSAVNLGSVGDLAGSAASGVNSSGPCKVYIGSALTTIRWTSCVAYSGGRRIAVAAQTSDLTVPLATSGTQWDHICLTGTNNQPISSPAAAGTGAENANLPAFSASAPTLCLADVLVSTTAVTNIYDTRTFTTSQHDYASITVATTLGNGVPVITSGVNVVAPGVSATANLVGVIATWGGGTSGTPNAILTIGGPTYAKATAGTAGAVVIPSATAGRVATGASVAGPYGDLGLMRSATWSATCTAATATTCQSSIYFNMILR